MLLDLTLLQFYNIKVHTDFKLVFKVEYAIAIECHI